MHVGSKHNSTGPRLSEAGQFEYREVPVYGYVLVVVRILTY